MASKAKNVSKAIIEINAHINLSATRALDVRHALSISGTKAIEVMFMATQIFVDTGKPDEMMKATQRFFDHLSMRPVSKLHFKKALGYKANKLDQLEKAYSA